MMGKLPRGGKGIDSSLLNEKEVQIRAVEKICRCKDERCCIDILYSIEADVAPLKSSTNISS